MLTERVLELERALDDATHDRDAARRSAAEAADAAQLAQADAEWLRGEVSRLRGRLDVAERHATALLERRLETDAWLQSERARLDAEDARLRRVAVVVAVMLPLAVGAALAV